MGHFEIERKFLIDGFPTEWVPVEEATVWQGYLATDPVVRIRKKEMGDTCSYRLCFKGQGTLVRREIELPLDEDTYSELCELLPAPPICKVYKIYTLPDGHRLECSLVDPDTPTSFYYAEVEFPSREEADAFTPPDFLGREVTEQPGYTMAEYWKYKKLG